MYVIHKVPKIYRVVLFKYATSHTDSLSATINVIIIFF